MSESKPCEHPTLPEIKFDAEAARQMSSHEVRTKFPRGCNRCDLCGQLVIQYASFEHYVAGDW